MTLSPWANFNWHSGLLCTTSLIYTLNYRTHRHIFTCQTYIESSVPLLSLCRQLQVRPTYKYTKLRMLPSFAIFNPDNVYFNVIMCMVSQQFRSANNKIPPRIVPFPLNGDTHSQWKTEYGFWQAPLSLPITFVHTYNIDYRYMCMQCPVRSRHTDSLLSHTYKLDVQRNEQETKNKWMNVPVCSSVHCIVSAAVGHMIFSILVRLHGDGWRCGGRLKMMAATAVMSQVRTER